MLIDRCRAGLCLAFLGLALAALPAPGAGAAPGTAFGPLSGSAATTALLAGSGAGEVTLITGDRVTVTLGHGVTAQAAPRAAGGSIGFQTTSFRGQLWVIPSDAAPLIAAGRLDRRLFDVRYLLANGYGDADSRELPVILEYAQGTPPARVGDRAAALPASTPTDRLESITGAALRVEKRDAEDLWSALQPQRTGSTALAGGLAKVWLDAKVHTTLDESVPLVGAPEAWTAGYDGSGVEVAVLDTGIDAEPSRRRRPDRRRGELRRGSERAGRPRPRDARRLDGRGHRGRGGGPLPRSRTGRPSAGRQGSRGRRQRHHDGRDRRHGVGGRPGRAGREHEPRRPAERRDRRAEPVGRQADGELRGVVRDRRRQHRGRRDDQRARDRRPRR